MPAPWPELDVARDQPTFATLHLVSQMLGKLRVAHAPWVNHGWHATLHPRPDGLAIDADRRPAAGELHADARPVPPRRSR